MPNRYIRLNISRVKNASSERNSTRWFNTEAFEVAPQFTVGNSSRNPVRGPGYRNVDVAVTRRFDLPRGRGLEVRVEAFNLTNTPPFEMVGRGAFRSDLFYRLSVFPIRIPPLRERPEDVCTDGLSKRIAPRASVMTVRSRLCSTTTRR